jgi:hypothetical protein
MKRTAAYRARRQRARRARQQRIWNDPQRRLGGHRNPQPWREWTRCEVPVPALHLLPWQQAMLDRRTPRTCKVCRAEFLPHHGEYHRCPECFEAQLAAAEIATGVQ